MRVEDEALSEAVKTLYLNMTNIGFTASPEKHVNYYSIWARDHSITSIGALLSGDNELIETAIKGIIHLLKHQSDYGQVPSYIEVENKRRVYGGLGAITSTDSNLWIVIAAALFYKHTKDARLISDAIMLRYELIYKLLRAFDSNQCGLIEVHVAGDWADIFNRNYHVLYDEALYYSALKALAYLHETKHSLSTDSFVRKNMLRFSRRMRRHSRETKRKINSTFWFTDDNREKIRNEYMIFNELDENYPYYQSHITPFKMYWQNQFDSFGNVLAILCQISNAERTKSIVDYVINNNINKPFPLTSLYPPVYKGEVSWQFIYETHEQPYTYHNGGIWPLIGGFWIAALVKAKKHKVAEKELHKLASTLKEQGYKFNEYMHGKTGAPMGRTYQAWSAASYIIAYKAVERHTAIFRF
jgi:sucrose-6-phosphatase